MCLLIFIFYYFISKEKKTEKEYLMIFLALSFLPERFFPAWKIAPSVFIKKLSRVLSSKGPFA